MSLLQRLLGQRGLLLLAAVLFVLVGVAVLVPVALLALPESAPEASPTPGPPDDPDSFSQWLTDSRGVEDGGLPVNDYVAAERALREMLARQQADDSDRARVLSSIGAAARPWTWLGPSNWGGRTRAFAVHPTNPQLMLAGGITGGVWRSEDAGASWSPLTDTFSNIAVGVLELDPSNPAVIYAGTGEAYWAHADRYRGDGIMKSTDSGVSWQFLESTVGNAAFAYVGDVEVSHSDPNRLYAATPAGVWLSVDGGISWGTEPVLASPSVVGCLELAIRADRSPDMILASCGHEASPDGVYRSADGGLTWERVFPEAGEVGRVALAIAPGNPDIIYASVSDVDDHAEGLYRSAQGGSAGSWELRAAPSTGSPDWLAYCDDPEIAQGGYDNTVAVDPTNPDRIWVGGIELFRSDDGGATLQIASDVFLPPVSGTSYVHADQHAIVFHPSYDGTSNRTVYFANDGGIFRTEDDRGDLSGSTCRAASGVAFSSLNEGYGVSQFVGGAVSDQGDIVVGGTQDNGSFRLDMGRPDEWAQIWGGDGGNGAVHPAGEWVIVSNYLISFVRLSGAAATGESPRCEYYGPECQPATGGITDGENAVFYPPLEMDPNDSNILWTGGRHIWRTTDEGRSWVKASGALGSAYVTALAIAPGDGNVVYAGMRDGSVYRSTDALSDSPTWTDVDPEMAFPTEKVAAIAIHPNDPNTAFVGFSYFGGNQLWKSTAGVGSWYSVDASIPDVPVNAVALNPRNPAMVYAGTDSGVFESLDGGESWRVANENLATTIVSRLVFRRDTSNLYAFTFGRGAYTVDVGDQSPPPNDEISAATDVVLEPEFRDRLDIRAASSAADDPALSCGSSLLPTQTRSVWYRFQPTESSRLAITTEGSNFDTVLAVFRRPLESGAPLEEVECNDDSVAALGPSSVVLDAEAGVTYYIEVTRSASSPAETLANTMVLTVRRP